MPCDWLLQASMIPVFSKDHYTTHHISKALVSQSEIISILHHNMNLSRQATANLKMMVDFHLSPSQLPNSMTNLHMKAIFHQVIQTDRGNQINVTPTMGLIKALSLKMLTLAIKLLHQDSTHLIIILSSRVDSSSNSTHHTCLVRILKNVIEIRTRADHCLSLVQEEVTRGREVQEMVIPRGISTPLVGSQAKAHITAMLVENATPTVMSKVPQKHVKVYNHTLLFHRIPDMEGNMGHRILKIYTRPKKYHQTMMMMEDLVVKLRARQLIPTECNLVSRYLSHR